GDLWLAGVIGQALRAQARLVARFLSARFRLDHTVIHRPPPSERLRAARTISLLARASAASPLSIFVSSLGLLPGADRAGAAMASTSPPTGRAGAASRRSAISMISRSAVFLPMPGSR